MQITLQRRATTLQATFSFFVISNFHYSVCIKGFILLHNLDILRRCRPNDFVCEDSKRISRYLVIPHWPHHQLSLAIILILVDSEVHGAITAMAVFCRCTVQAWLCERNQIRDWRRYGNRHVGDISIDVRVGRA